ncbi:MAG TPA: hypothetical protein VN661_02150 [Candidatus Acidoferrales bacterium]|nr:hypothetical protein [Candidatus Acidoferrales bacterium]
MSRNTAILRSHVESELRGRVASPFAEKACGNPELVSSGIPEIDALSGGLPRGALTEIYGPPCSGRMTLLVSMLAERTAETEACALIDVQDTFDPLAAAAAGVALDRLLWVRCKSLDQGLRAADLLVRGGGFGLIAMDLSETAPKTARAVPLNVWFRFRRAVENTATILALFAQQPNAPCASLVLGLQAEAARWRGASAGAPSFIRLLENAPLEAAIVRSRIPRPGRKCVHIFPRRGSWPTDAATPPGRIEPQMAWAISPDEKFDPSDSDAIGFASLYSSS